MKCQRIYILWLIVVRHRTSSLQIYFCRRRHVTDELRQDAGSNTLGMEPWRRCDRPACQRYSDSMYFIREIRYEPRNPLSFTITTK